MQSSRWKQASLAINAIIRGLELDQVAFRYDETACREHANLLAGSASAANDGRAELNRTSSSLQQ
jgi:hypothetical protein